MISISFRCIRDRSPHLPGNMSPRVRVRNALHKISNGASNRMLSAVPSPPSLFIFRKRVSSPLCIPLSPANQMEWLRTRWVPLGEKVEGGIIKKVDFFPVV
ncbi:hypothetical protein CDAR_179331 [Caerostris darwini]|uniref:Uncharacterized protein n=1 Tax=Caerostris darwini TaxID=1538125 RepID=A0AAV4P9N4_9ARAC|nr:hypothetical protein CDAR_179331 [Caerostris darwini]